MFLRLSCDLSSSKNNLNLLLIRIYMSIHIHKLTQNGLYFQHIIIQIGIIKILALHKLIQFEIIALIGKSIINRHISISVHLIRS